MAVIALAGCGVAPLEPESAEREIVRLLKSAAAHATKSGACYDGHGNDVMIDRIEVIPGGAANRFAVSYRVTDDPEGDTRGCPPPCDDFAPAVSEHQTEIAFERGRGGYRIVVPKELPGVRLFTPLDREHDGDCLADAPPFEPAWL